LVAQLVAVVEAWESRRAEGAGPEPVGRFAERVLGSAHGLDADRPLTALAFGAARALTGATDGAGAAWRRDVWASVGLLRDELSSTALVLGLRGDTSPTGRALTALADAGEPAVLTLRQLRVSPLPDLTGSTVSVCENPVVLAEAADRLGPATAPLVCLNGQPGAAVMAVLHAAVAAGARLRHHGDFDWGGLRIGNLLHARLPITPWRFDAAAYRAAGDGDGEPLRGSPVACAWDPELTDALSATGRAVEEERVIDDLLGDLAPPTL
ncbi:MAG: TIGR02679 family protein, partial [Pseudonocardiales bacterium]|nr:TIGR02679 family protein [Pseudonocardiales bacterium]